jgi:protein involved in polysaccharide export with SLBB domain
VEIQGHVKRPGRYQFNQGMTARELVEQAGGPWPDVLLDVAVIDRIDAQEQLTTVTLPLGAILAGTTADVPLMERDVLQVFAQGVMRDADTVSISGEVREPGELEFRRGMTLLDLIVRAGGITSRGDLERVEIHRLEEDKVFSAAATPPDGNIVETIVVNMAPDYLRAGSDILLEPFDQVVVRRLPWYQEQRLVQVRGEVLYNGTFALESNGERLSSVIERAGGLKPTAYARGARVVRSGIGNVAVDLQAALADPGGPQDIILQDRDQILVPEHLYTVQVTGEVGFPTALVYENGKKIDWYVDRAGGYLEQADKGRSRVIHPNGLSQPNKGGHQVLPGSTIVVPVKPPPEGRDTLETVRDFTTILLGLATVWLAIDRASN